MKLFCDMDMVLVRQTGRDGYDVMPWMPDGKLLWEFIKPLEPTILSMLPDWRYENGAAQKLKWCARELGAAVPVIITPDSKGKAPHASRNAVLIDDSVMHAHGWAKGGGIFVLHKTAATTICQLRELMA